MDQKILIHAQHLQKYFPLAKKSLFQRETEYVKANKDITLKIYKGETLGIVGESGCGKSTFGRTLIQLQKQTGGGTMYYGETIENIMPKYVKTVYKNLAKTSKTYDEDKARLESLQTDNTKGDAYRIAKIEFELKYMNTLKLGGGLLVHEDLNLVSKILLEKYEIEAKLAAVHREIEFERLRLKVVGDPSDLKARIAALEINHRAIGEKVTLIRRDLKALKDTLRSHPRFDYYENFRDHGIDLASLTKKEMGALRDDLQIIFQDPYSSLDPRFTVGDIIGEGLITHGLFKNRRSEGYLEYIQDIMEKCGLDPEFMHRYPHQFSGGQRQRVGIARAIAMKPKFIVCDEAVSALDVSIQSQIINLLQDLKEREALTYLFITHDLGVVRYISDRIGVMYFGNLVELAPAEEIFNNPKHPYTKRLLAAIPTLDQEAIKAVSHEADDLFTFDFETSGEADPDWVEVAPEHFVACKLGKDVEMGGSV